MFRVIDEDEDVFYSSEENLSYYDDGNQFNFRDCVAVFDEGKYLGDCVVWLDSEMDNREYIVINYTIIYLDTIKNTTVK